MSKEDLNVKWISPEIVCSFPNLAEPAAPEYGGKFALSIPLPKDDSKAVESLQQVIKNAAINKWGEKAADLRGIKHFVEDCDKDSKYDDDAIYRGCLRFSAKANKRPGLVYANLSPVEQKDIEDVFYPGAIIRVSVSAYGTETGGSKTVAFGLNNVMFVRDGNRIGGGSKAEDDFGAFKDDSFDRFASSESQDNSSTGNLF